MIYLASFLDLCDIVPVSNIEQVKKLRTDNKLDIFAIPDNVMIKPGNIIFEVNEFQPFNLSELFLKWFANQENRGLWSFISGESIKTIGPKGELLSVNNHRVIWFKSDEKLSTNNLPFVSAKRIYNNSFESSHPDHSSQEYQMVDNATSEEHNIDGVNVTLFVPAETSLPGNINKQRLYVVEVYWISEFNDPFSSGETLVGVFTDKTTAMAEAAKAYKEAEASSDFIDECGGPDDPTVTVVAIDQIYRICQRWS